MKPLRVLVLARTFLPVVGGMEIAIDLLAREWSRSGVDVTLLTRTRGDGSVFPYRVERAPGPLRTIRLAHAADVIYSRNVSLRGLWPLAFVRRPWVVSHHSWYRRSDGRVVLADRLKLAVLRRADESIGVSLAIAELLGPETRVMPNPFRDEVFHPRPEIAISRDLVFVGRMVSDKGIDVLVRALAILASKDLRPTVTLVGDGPEAAPVREALTDLRLDAQVRWAGVLHGEELAREMARHQIMVVPSRYAEPFGIVAVEGAASGCVVIGSEGGGLAEAIGPCGLLFPNGDARALADRIERVLVDPALRARLRAAAPAHVDRFRARNVAERYVAVFERLAGRQRAR
jgi:glycogen synthase